MSSNIQLNIINIYNQFLRLCNFNFEILILNKRLDIEKYIKEYYFNYSKISEDIYLKYIQDISNKLRQEDMYETKMYIIVSDNFKVKSSIGDYEKVIYRLDEIGCKVRKINTKKEYEELLYKCINKV